MGLLSWFKEKPVVVSRERVASLVQEQKRDQLMNRLVSDHRFLFETWVGISNDFQAGRIEATTGMLRSRQRADVMQR